jgi:hypothetical protein
MSAIIYKEKGSEGLKYINYQNKREFRERKEKLEREAMTKREEKRKGKQFSSG